MNAIAERVAPTPQLNDQMVNALEAASAATLLLADMGIRVIAALANGRQPLLMVNRLPESVPSVIKRQHPNGMGGMSYVRAAQFFGCQLEYLFDRNPPALSVVPADSMDFIGDALTLGVPRV